MVSEPDRPARRHLSGSLEVESAPEEAFALLAAVEKWPLWLSFLRTSRLADPSQPLQRGSEVLVRSAIPGDPEQLYEVDVMIANYHLSLVGAYSVRRRIDFRIERKTSRSKIHVKVEYPSYHGRVGAWIDSVLRGRKLSAALDRSLHQFKGLVEVLPEHSLLADL